MKSLKQTKNVNFNTFLDCNDVVSHVFSFCSIKQLGSIATVNRTFESLSKQELTERKKQIEKDYLDFGLVYAGQPTEDQKELIKHLDQHSVDENNIEDFPMLLFKYEKPVKILMIGNEQGTFIMKSLAQNDLSLEYASKEISGRKFNLSHTTHKSYAMLGCAAHLRTNNIIVFLSNNDNEECQTFIHENQKLLQEKLFIYVRVASPNSEQSKDLLEHDLAFSKKLSTQYGSMISILNINEEQFTKPIIGTKILEKIDQKLLVPLARKIVEAEESAKKITPRKKQKETCIIS